MYGDPDKYFMEHGTFEKKAEAHRVAIREIKRRTGVPNPTILDVGSGRGEMLEAARREGVTTAIGLELSAAMIDSASSRGMTVLPVVAEDYAAQGYVFDCVVLAAVAEHVENPDSLIAAAAKMCRPGGLLLIDVPREPNIVTSAGRVAEVVRRRPAVLNLSPTFSPFHVYGFNPRSLRLLLAKHGFDLTDLVVKGVPWWAPPSDGSLIDRSRAALAAALSVIGNLTRTAPNMTGWAVRRP